MFTANNKMMEILFARLVVGENLPDELRFLLETGIELKEGATILKGLNNSLSRQDMDLTGFECLVNHVHIDDYVDNNLLPCAITFCKDLIDLLTTSQGKRFRIILAYVLPTKLTSWLPISFERRKMV